MKTIAIDRLLLDRVATVALHVRRKNLKWSDITLRLGKTEKAAHGETVIAGLMGQQYYERGFGSVLEMYCFDHGLGKFNNTRMFESEIPGLLEACEIFRDDNGHGEAGAGGFLNRIQGSFSQILRGVEQALWAEAATLEEVGDVAASAGQAFLTYLDYRAKFDHSPSIEEMRENAPELVAVLGLGHNDDWLRKVYSPFRVRGYLTLLAALEGSAAQDKILARKEYWEQVEILVKEVANEAPDRARTILENANIQAIFPGKALDVAFISSDDQLAIRAIWDILPATVVVLAVRSMNGDRTTIMPRGDSGIDFSSVLNALKSKEKNVWQVSRVSDRLEILIGEGSKLKLAGTLKVLSNVRVHAFGGGFQANIGDAQRHQRR